MRSRSFFFFAALASIWWLGAWDNQRAAERVLAEGYETTAKITGIHENRHWPAHVPFTLDGLRPRFLDQPRSMGLKWRGRDGAEHEASEVQITESYFRRIATEGVGGWSQTYFSAQVKVLDDGSVVDLSNVEDRLRSLGNWRICAGYPAAALWGLGALVFLWRRLTGRHRLPPPPSTFGVSPAVKSRMLMFCVLCFVGAGYEPYRAWSDQQRREAFEQRGVEAVAQISHPTGRTSSKLVTYGVDLTWKDRSGADRRSSFVHVSQKYWDQIMRSNLLVVSETRIRYLEDDDTTTPMVLGDTGALQRVSTDWGAVFSLIWFSLFFGIMWLWVPVRR